MPYTTPFEDTDCRVSDSKQIRCTPKKELFATQAMLDAANEALVRVKAFVKLEFTPNSLERRTQGKFILRKVVPAWNADFGPKSGYHHDLSKKNVPQTGFPPPRGYTSHADCHRNAQTVMGSNSLGSVDDTEDVVIQKVGGRTVLEHFTKVMINNDSDRPTSLDVVSRGNDSHANRGVYKFFESQLPDFAGVVRASRSDVAESIDRLGGTRFTIAKAYKWWAIYEAIMSEPGSASLLASTFGINEQANPLIGEGVSQINNERTRETAPSGVDYWNFHWAGVVMKDGDTFVTLENLSIEDDDAKNQDWYFKMYGIGDQSFHKDSDGNPHVGPRPITLRFVSTPPPVRGPLQAQALVCPKCQRSDFKNRGELMMHKGGCGL